MINARPSDRLVSLLSWARAHAKNGKLNEIPRGKRWERMRVEKKEEIHTQLRLEALTLILSQISCKRKLAQLLTADACIADILRV